MIKIEKYGIKFFKNMDFVTQTEHRGPLSDIPLKINKSDNFYRHLLYRYESSRTVIESYNYSIENIIPQIFIGEYEVRGKGNISEKKLVTKVIIDWPKLRGKDLGERITPRMAKAFNSSYMSGITLEVLSNSNLNGVNNVFMKREYIGSIPTMIGSNRCYTSTKPDEFKNLDEWKFYCGECPSSPGGYFINKGAEKAIIHQEKLRTCDYFTVKNKKTPPQLVTTITCINRSETTIVRLQTGKHQPTIKVLLPHAKGKHYPFYLVIFLLLQEHNKLNQTNIQFDINMPATIIASLVPENEAQETKLALDPSLVKFQRRFYELINGEYRIKENAITDYISKRLPQKSNDDEPTRSTSISVYNQVNEAIFNDCFKQCPLAENKIANLCVMAAQHIRCFLKNRALDSRDLWGHKKVDGPARLIELLTNQIFNSMKATLKVGSGDLMSETFKSSFNSYQWGFGRGQRKENVAEALKTDTILSVNSQLSKINTPVDRRIKSFAVRGVHPSQMGIICPAETPEGETCGLVKHLSATTHISFNRAYEPERRNLFNSMRNDIDYMSNYNESENCKYALYIDSSLITFNSGRTVYVSDVFVKQFSKFPKAFDIVYTEDRKSLNITLKTKEGKHIFDIQHWSVDNIRITIPPSMLPLFQRLFGTINKFFSTHKSSEHDYSLSINGDMFIRGENMFYPAIIWVNPDRLVSFLKERRRNRELPRDCCIFKNKEGRIIQYFDDGGREMSPLLIVDTDGNLVADKIKIDDVDLWDTVGAGDYQNSYDYIERFYNYGALELLDVKEYDSVFIAETIDEVRFFSGFRKFLEKVIPESITYLGKTTILADSTAGSSSDLTNSQGPALHNSDLTIGQSLHNMKRIVIKNNIVIDERECDNYMASIRMDYQLLKNFWEESDYMEQLIEESNEEKIDDGIENTAKGERIIVDNALKHFRQVRGVQYLKEKFHLFTDEEVFYKMLTYMKTRFLFTHSFVNANSMFSDMANLVPRPGSGAGPRFTYQAAMGKQALNYGSTVDYTSFPTSNKREIAPRRSNFETVAEQPLMINTMPITENVVLMIGAHRNGYEDATIMSRSYSERFMRYEKGQTYKTAEIINNDYVDTVSRPDVGTNSKNKNLYRHLGEDGLPRLGSIICEGDCVIGKVRRMLKTDVKVDMSVFAGVGDIGEVSFTQITYGEEAPEKYRIFQVRTIHRRYQIVGGKLAFKYAQKGTIGRKAGDGIDSLEYIARIIDDNEMPFVRGGPNHGVRPDMIFNPAGIPSRMTCGMIEEILTSKAVSYTQDRVNASNFATLNMADYCEILFRNGMDKWGNEFISHSDGEIMIDSTTGKEYKAYIGICASQVLRHQVEDKIQARANGRVEPKTRQPVSGRNNHGGLKLGEMELDALKSHGGSRLIIERLMKSSDEYKTTYCNCCHNLSADSPVESDVCRICKNKGSLGVITHPRVFMIFSNIMASIGINVNLFTKEIKDTTIAQDEQPVCRTNVIDTFTEKSK